MAQGPSIQGQIVINTQSVDKAITSVRKLQTNVQKSFGLGGQAAANFSKTLDRQTQSYNKVAQSNQKYQNIIAKAANKVANYEAAVRKSNASDSKKAALIKAATAELKGFEQAVRSGATSGKSLDNVNTQLAVSMGQLKRNLASASQAEAQKTKTAKQLEQAQIRTDKAVSQASIQYQKAAQAVKDSGMAEADKLKTMARLDAQYKKLTTTLTNSTTGTRRAAAAQNSFRESLSQVNAEARNSRTSQQATATNRYATEMRNLSTSVVVALGPLSGVASRLTALTTLFNRNAASIALVLASMTALSVAFARSAKTAEEAEKQMFRINAQLGVLGDTAQITGDEINAMAHSIASSTLLSAKEVRDASGALLQFGGIGRSQYDDVTKAAQGMSVVVGGSLQSNIRKLGRAIDDPADGLQRLERYGVILTDAVNENIKALSAQGNKMEATSVLMKELTGLQKAAEAEALGLAGAYDTVSGNLDKLMEDLFINSGAAKAMADSIMGVANAIKDFSGTAQAAALGQVFQKMATVAGAAFKFALDNLHLFGGALAFIVGSTVPKALIAFVSLAGTGLAAIKTQTLAAVASLRSFSVAQGTAAASTRALTMALLSNPLTAIAVGIASVTAAWWGYNEVIQEIESGRASAQDAIINSVEAEIQARMDLTKTQADLYRDDAKLLQDRANTHAQVMERMKKQEEGLANRAKDVLGDLAKERRGAAGMEVYVTSTRKLLGLLEKDLTPAQEEYIRKILATREKMERLEESAENVNNEARKLKDIINEADPSEEVTPAMVKLNDQLKLMTKYSKEFLPDTAKMDELKSELAQAQALSKGLSDSIGDVPKRSEEARAAFERSKLVIQAIKTEMEELAAVDISKNVVKFKESLRDAAMEANKLHEMVGASDAAKPYIELNYEMAKLRASVASTVAEMNPEQVAQFAQALGMDAGSGSSEIIDQYVAAMEAQKQSAIEAKKLISANETVDQFQKSQLSSMQALKAEYKELGTAALDAGRTEDMPDINEYFKKEKAAIEAQATQTASTPFTNLDTIEQEFAARSELLTSLYSKDEEKQKEHLDRLNEQYEKNKGFMTFAKGAEQASDIVGGAMKAMETAGKENTKAYQAMAIVQATISAAVGIAKIWGADAVNPAIAIAKTALIAANVGAQIAAIKSQSYASGGYVSGPGTSKSDSISANLSNGEFVMQAEAVKAIGQRNLAMMNNGQMPAFSAGGPVGVMPIPSKGGSGGSGGLNVTIVDQSTGKKEYTTEETTDPSGQRNLKVMVRDAVKDSINKGELDREMSNSYGVRRKGRRV